MNLKKILKKLKLSEQTISMFLGALVIVVIGVLLFNYFRGVGKKETAPTTTSADTVKLVEEGGKMVPEGLPTTHKVIQGENLWTIAEKYYGSGYNWVDVAKANKLVNPNRLLVGQELNIPQTEVRKPAKTVKQGTTQSGEAITGSNYTVVKGDYLWNLAVRAYGDGFKWVEIAKANNIARPNLIYPGTVLSIPR